jgi:hypothetical protein
MNDDGTGRHTHRNAGSGTYGRVSRLTTRIPAAARIAVSAKRPLGSSVGIDVSTITGVGVNRGVGVDVVGLGGVTVGVLVGA